MNAYKIWSIITRLSELFYSIYIVRCFISYHPFATDISFTFAIMFIEIIKLLLWLDFKFYDK